LFGSGFTGLSLWIFAGIIAHFSSCIISEAIENSQKPSNNICGELQLNEKIRKYLERTMAGWGCSTRKKAPAFP
jgi:hypothetical protein